MSEYDDDSFKNMNWKGKIIAILGLTLFIALVIGFVIGMYFLGFAGLFEVLGVHYQSIWSLIIFVISVFFVGMILELLFDAFAVQIIKNIRGDAQAFFVQLLFEYAENFLVLVIVDTWMESIALSPSTRAVVALFLAFFGTVFDNKKAKTR